MSTWDLFYNNTGRSVLKWTHYFPAYERHFSPWRNRSLTFIEIGVLGGGSLEMWYKYFGPLATIIGIDINPACKEYERAGINVRIGDQSDPKFLQSVIDEFGIPDIVLDDGSHIAEHQRASFEFFYPRMPKNSVYMVEDLHTSYWPSHNGGINNPNSFVNYSKNLIDQLNADWDQSGQVTPTQFTRETLTMSYYDSIIVFEKGNIPIKESWSSGRS